MLNATVFLHVKKCGVSRIVHANCSFITNIMNNQCSWNYIKLIKRKKSKVQSSPSCTTQ